MIKAKEGKIMVNGPADEIFGDFVGIIKAIYECFEGVAGEKTARQMIADAGRFAFGDEIEDLILDRIDLTEKVNKNEIH